jgi:glycine/serine hydroxymethyltransferase
MRRVADLSVRIIDHLDDNAVRDEVAQGVRALCNDHPLYVDRCV